MKIFGRILTSLILILGLTWISFTWSKNSKNNIYQSNLGYHFQIPKGWILKDHENGHILGSNTEAGLILVEVVDHHDQNKMRSYILDSLKKNGLKNLKTVSKNKNPLELHATAQDGAAMGSIHYFVSQHKKNPNLSLLISGITTRESKKFSNIKKRSQQIAKSAALFKTKNSPATQTLTGVWWHYQDTSGLNSSGGYEHYLYLCSGGVFKSSGSASQSFQTNDPYGNQKGSGGSAVTSQRHGKWKAIGNARSGTVLIHKVDGSKANYTYQLPESGIALFNGTKYFKKSDESCR